MPWGGQGSSLPDLAPFHVVVLCNVADISAADATTLARFVESGGNLIIFTGDQVEAGAYAALAQARLLPGTGARPGRASALTDSSTGPKTTRS